MLVTYYIYGLIVAAILMMAVLIKYRSKGIRGEWILAGFLIAIMSLPLGLILTPVLEIMTRLFLPGGGVNQIFSVLLMFIILSICYTYLRKGSAFLFAKVSVVSFIILLLLTITWFSFSISEGGMFMVINEVNIPADETDRYVEITQEELEEYPPLKKAMKAYIESKNNNFKVDTEDERRVSDFFNKKRYDAMFLFSISNGKSEEYLNKGVVSQELNNLFISNNLSISGNATIDHVSEPRWHIFEKRELTYEILKEGGALNVYDGKYSGDIFFKIGEKYYKISLFQAD